jgi:hypothetical protein
MACGAKSVVTAAEAPLLTIQSPKLMRGYAMNGNNIQIEPFAANPARGPLSTQATPAWRWIFIGQLLMMAAFAGLSLTVTAVAAWVAGSTGHGREQLLATGLAGGLLVAFAWLALLRLLRHVDGETPIGPGPGVRLLTQREAA